MPKENVRKIRIDERCEYRLRRGMPWIFDKYCHLDGEASAGDLVAVYNRRDKCIAIGLHDPYSPIRVRILGQKCIFDETYIARAFRNALQSRIALGIAGAETTGLRLLSGESEGLPGIVVDAYAGTWVAKVYSAIWLPHFDRFLDALKSYVGIDGAASAGAYFVPLRRIVLRFGRECRSVFEAHGYREGQLIAGTDETPHADFLENGIHFRAQVFRGQKTGFFLDQRENRRLIRSISAGKRVLDICCYSGGFSVSAAKGGASSVWSLDADKHALDLVAEHFRLNGGDRSVASCGSVLEKSNMREWLERAKSRRMKFDLIIADPPCFASSQAQIPSAERAYMHLFSAASDCLNPGGQILCCSCSSHIGAEKFAAIVDRALRHKTRSSIDYTGLPGDHVARFAEARYLKAWLVTVK